MSKQVDERVVSMQFDNSHFEKNVSQSMSTLEKLKKSLSFSGATKGLEDINTAAGKVNMSGLGNSVETVKAKFSAMEVVAVTALANITNSAVNAAKNMISSLTIAPISDGFKEYELTLNAIQTTMAGTGKTAEEVEKELKKLDEYADKTVYSTADMLNNLPKFTNAGVELETATKAMIGIANATAHAGGDAGKASIAFYNLGQAIGTGYLTRMDYNSINNAGIATMEWKEAMVEAAIAQGTLTKVGEDSYKVGNKTMTLQQLFIDGLQEQWASTEVMLKVFGDYGDETTEIGKKAYASAQDIKTFTMMMESLKATAGTGWKDTWQLIFGGLDEAKEFWTGLNKVISGMIEGMADLRNGILEGALGKNFTALTKPLEGIKEIVSGVTDPVENIIRTLEDYNRVVDEVIKGDWGKTKVRWDALTEAGYDWVTVQNMVNAELGVLKHRQTDYVIGQDKMTESTEEATDSNAKYIAKLAEMSEAELKALGLTEEQITAIKELKKQADKLGLSVEYFVENVDEIDGRWVLINIFKNAWAGLVKVFESVKAAWQSVFPPKTMEERSQMLYDIIAAIHKFSTKLIMSDETAEKLTRTFKGLFAIVSMVKTVVGGGFTLAFKILSQILSYFDLDILDVTAAIGDAVVAFQKWFDSIFDISGVLDVVIPLIQKTATALQDWFKAFKETPAVQKLVDAIDAIREAFSKLTSGEISLAEFATSLGKNLAKALKSLPGIALQVGKDFIAGFQNGIGDSVSGVIDKVVDFCLNLVAGFKEALGVHSPSWKAYETATDFFQGFINGVKDSTSGVLSVLKKIGEAIIKVFKSFWEFITDESGKVEWGKLIAGGVVIAMGLLLKQLVNAFSSIANALDGVGDILQNAGRVLKSFSSVLNGIAWDLKAKALMKMAISIGILVAALWVLTELDDSADPWKLWRCVGILVVLAGVLVGLAFAMDKISAASVKVNKSGASIDGIKSGLLQIGIALLLVAGVVKIIGDMDPEKAKAGFIGLAGIAVGMVVFMAAMGGISRYSGDVSAFGGVMTKVAIAMGIMVIVMKMVAKMDPEDIVIGVAVLEAFVLLCIQMGIANRIAGQNGNKFGGNVLKISIAMGILVIVMKMLAGMNPEDILTGVAVLEAFVLLVAQMGIANRIAGDNANNFGKTVKRMATAMLILTAVIWLLSKMDPEDVKNGIVTMQYFVLLIAEMILVSNLAGKESAKIAGNLLGMSAAVAILAGVAIMLSMIDTEGLAKGVIAVGALGLVMATMIWAARGVQDVKGSLTAMSVAIAIMAAAVVALSFIDGSKLAGATAAIGSLMLCFALMTNSIRGGKGSKLMIKTLIVMVGVVAILAGLIALLSKLEPNSVMTNVAALSLLMLAFSTSLRIISKGGRVSKSVAEQIVPMIAITLLLAVLITAMSQLSKSSALIPSAVALGILLNAFAAAMVILSKASSISKSVASQLDSMLLVAIGLGAILIAMSRWSDPSALIPSAVALGILLNAFAAAMVILSKASSISKSVASQLDSMLLVAIGLGAILIAMSRFSDPSALIPSAVALGILLNALSAALVILGYAGPNASKAVPAAMLMGVVLLEIAVVLGIMSAFDITPSIETALALSTLMLALSAACLIVSKVPSAAAIDGALGLAAFIGIMAGVIAILGGLSKIPGFNELLADGGTTLGLIGSAIGNFVGGIVGGVLSGIGNAILDLLPRLGEALSQFMEGAQTFIGLASQVDASVVVGAGFIAAAIIALSAANFISGITEILSFGSSFSELGMELCKFGTYASVFFNTIKGVDESAVGAASNVASMILTLTGSNLISTLTDWLGGSTDFATLGQNLKTFGEAVVSFSNTISGKVDVAAVEAATNAGMLLAELNKALPRSGGLLQDLIGEQDFEKFATACKAFAKCILEINAAVSQEGFVIETEKIEQLVVAGEQFNRLNTALPRTGGIAQDLAGEQDLAGFGVACVAFANCMIEINKAVSQEGFAIQNEKIEQLVVAGEAFNRLNTALPKTGGIAQDLAGKKDLAGFGESVKAFAGCMIEVNQAVSQEGFAVNLEAMEALKQGGLKMNSLQNVLPKSGGWWQKISGEKDIGDFGKKIVTFADSLVDFSTAAAELNSGAIATAISTSYRIKSLIESLVGLDTSGVKTFTGIGTGGIGADGPAYDIAQAIAKFSEKVADINTNAVTVAVTQAGKLKSLIASLVGLDTSGIKNFKLDSIGSQMKDYGNKVADLNTATLSASITAANKLKSFIASLVGLDSSGIVNFKVGSIGTNLRTYAGQISGVNPQVISNSITAAKQLKSFIASLSGLDSSGVSNFKVGSIGTTLKTYSVNVSGVNFSAIISSITAAKQLKSFISGLAGLDTSGVGSFKSAVNDLSTVNISAMVEAFSGASAKLSSAGVEMINGLVKGMQSRIPAVKQVTTALLTTSNNAIRSKISMFQTAGGALAMKLASGFSSKKGTVKSAISSCLSAASSSIRDKYSSFYSAGSYLVSGFSSGISANSYKAAAKAKAMAEAAVEAARKALKINSPSKVFKAIGSGIPEGFAMGIGMLGSSVDKSVTDMASTAINSARSTMGVILDALSGDMDAQPTIRPVIDLTDVKTGANAISGLFSGTQSIGVQSNLSAINIAMNRRLQNGTNDDIVSAINKLNDGLEGTRGDIYNFEGITYNNGDEISEAVQTLVRAAKMGRRV